MKGFITNIKRNSLDDGPGIRSVIFFKGCPLRCVWCQNPETQTLSQEISYDSEKCIRCQTCQENCSENIIDLSKEYPINQDLCTNCGLCVKKCRMEALEFVGSTYTTDELIEKVLQDKIFYKNSGGGITLSGGEPMMQVKFISDFLTQLKPYDLHVCLETCGFFESNSFFTEIISNIDLIYFDLKVFDESQHTSYCGVSNKLILKNFERIIKLKSTKLLPRIPLIPKITTSNKNLENWAQYLKSFNIKKIGLLPYNPLWLSKMNKLGKKLNYKYSDWLSDKEKQKIKKIFSDFEFRNF